MEINKIYNGDSLEILKTFQDNTIDCCVTSPPYFQLREYPTATWIGGDPNCDHKIPESEYDPKKGEEDLGNSHAIRFNREKCYKCGAKRVDKQIGLESTYQEYISKLTEIFGEIYRILKPSGTLFINIGDTYAGNCSIASNNGRAGFGNPREGLINRTGVGIKHKDMIGIPWELGLALRNWGWYLRQDIIWQKKNCLPSSVQDRWTSSHEYILFLTKSPKYYFDRESTKEPCKTKPTIRDKSKEGYQADYPHGNRFSPGKREYGKDGMRLGRDVWDMNIRPYKEAHFATFPEELPTKCITAGCPKNGIVLDPFFGAGTVGLACKHTGRNYIGIELCEKYCELAQKRIGENNGII